MVSTTRWTGVLFVLLAALTAAALANTPVRGIGTSRGYKNISTNKSRKRQEIIFLRDDSTQKRNRPGETMANIEKHGKSLSAEGEVLKGSPKANNYDDSLDYQGPALREQSVKKYNGPPEIQENQKKSDAYEVVSDNGDNRNTGSMSKGEYHGVRVVKVGHPLARAHSSDRHTSHFKGHHRSGLHIVSLDDDDDDDDDNTYDKDSEENSLREKDLRLYGSIGSPSSSSVRHNSNRMHHSIYQNEFIPPNVVSFSQDDLTGPLPRGAGHSREEIFPSFRRRDSVFSSRPSQLQQPEDLMQQQFQPISPKSISFGDRPNMLYLPIYNGNADTSPAVVPMTTQGTFASSSPQFGAAPLDYSSPPTTGSFRSGLLLEPALQVPQVQTQSVNPSFILPSQPDGQILFNNQQPDVRSLYSLQTQPQMQFSQIALPQVGQPQQPIIQPEMQMTPDILSPAGQRDIGPAHRWVDEDGRERSEVLDRETDRQDDDRSQDDRNEDDEDEEDDDKNRSSRYYDRDDDTRPDEGDDDRAQEEPQDEDSEDRDEAEEETDDGLGTGRMYGSKDTGDESPDPDPTEDDEDQDPDPPQGGSIPQENMPPFNSNAMTRFMAPARSFPKFRLPLNTENPGQMTAQAFSRYQLMSPSSALKENILPKPDEGPKPSPHIANSKSDFKISQMSPAEAQFYENKAAMEPNFTPSISSKDTIPGKSRRFRVGLRNVLIRLNGEPLEDSSQLRSKIVNGQIIQGKGKLIKSKGPVRVKLSHTKGAKHLKIIDIIAPKQFQVYDTKSKIRRPVNDPFQAEKFQQIQR